MPVDAAALEEPDVRGVEVGIVLGVHQQERVAGWPEHRLGARARSSAISGLEMSATTKPTDRVSPRRRLWARKSGSYSSCATAVEHALAHLVADVGVVREDPRHRRDRDVRELRDLAHARAATTTLHPLTPVDASLDRTPTRATVSRPRCRAAEPS